MAGSPRRLMPPAAASALAAADAQRLAQPAAMRSWPLGTPRRTGIHDLAPARRRRRLVHRAGAAATSAGSIRRAAAASSSRWRRLVAARVIQGRQAAWITDGGLSAIVRVELARSQRCALSRCPPARLRQPEHRRLRRRRRPLVHRPERRRRQVATKTRRGHASRTRRRAAARTASAPRRDGDVWWCSLAGSFIARIDRAAATRS